MKYRRLGNSGLKVSEIGLGTNAFGGRVDEKTSIKTIERALELGINFIDTADVYTKGRYEEIIGKVVQARRSDVIIATKFGIPTANGRGASRHYLLKAIEASLKRLNTDYIDLYYVHMPDMETPIEETLRTLDGLIRAGKVRYIACSNFAPWQLSEAVWTAKINNKESFVATQCRYNILDRSIEKELIPCCQTHGIGFIPWGPLASGLLTGKYNIQILGTDNRLTNKTSVYGDLVTEANFNKIARLENFARAHGHSLGDLAIAWLLSHPWLSSVIAGATNGEQVTSNVTSAEWVLTADDLKVVGEII